MRWHELLFHSPRDNNDNNNNLLLLLLVSFSPRRAALSRPAVRYNPCFAALVVLAVRGVAKAAVEEAEAAKQEATQEASRQRVAADAAKRAEADSRNEARRWGTTRVCMTSVLCPFAAARRYCAW